MRYKLKSCMLAKIGGDANGGPPKLPFSALLDADFSPFDPPRPEAVAAAALAFSGRGCGLLLVTGLPVPLEALRVQLLAAAPSLPPLAELLREGLGSDTAPGGGAPASATLQLAWAAAGGGPRPPAPLLPPPDGGLRAAVEALGAAYAAIAVGVAAACDAWAGASGLRRALAAAGGAKARLIHYGVAGAAGGGAAEPWQRWHKDYGLFTAVSAPAYWRGAAAAPPPRGAGLHVLRSGSGAVEGAHIDEGCVGVQAGEAAQILSGGAVAAAPHCVLRPPADADGDGSWRRAAFVVFCTPPAELALSAPSGAAAGAAAAAAAEEEGPAWAGALGGLLPPLASRWDAQQPPTFAEFGRRTVAAYFGKRGTQRAKQ